jgi:hypothetical protein
VLAIKLENRDGKYGIRGHVWIDWHIGEPVPEDLPRVVTMQVDGDELNLFLDAMSASAGDDPRVEWRKRGRFTAKPTEPTVVYGELARPSND